MDGVLLEDGETVVQDRRSLAQYGMLMVICAVDMDRGAVVSDVDVVGKGFSIAGDVRGRIINAVYDSILDTNFDHASADDVAKNVKRGIRKLFSRDQKYPIIIPIIVEA